MFEEVVELGKSLLGVDRVEIALENIDVAKASGNPAKLNEAIEKYGDAWTNAGLRIMTTIGLVVMAGGVIIRIHPS